MRERLKKRKVEETRITFDEAVQVIITGLFFILVTSFIARIWGFYKLPKEGGEKKLPSNVLIGAFAVFLIFSVIIGPLFSSLGLYLYTGELRIDNQMTNILVSSLSIVITFMGVFLFYFFLKPENQVLIVGKNFGPLVSFKKTAKDFFFGIITWFLAFPFVMVVGKLIYLILYFFGLEVIPNQIAVSQVKNSLESPSIFSFIALNIVLFVPILEEFVFRGCLQTWIRTRIGIVKAIILTSIVFAAFHFSIHQGLGNIELLVSLFILSCFLGFIYERQKSLLASISLHAFFNGVTVAMILLSKEST